MVEPGRVPGKGRIRASIEELSERVSKNGRIKVSTEKWKNPGEYREKVESGWVSGKGRICASTEKKSGQLPKKGVINVTTEKW